MVLASGGVEPEWAGSETSERGFPLTERHPEIAEPVVLSEHRCARALGAMRGAEVVAGPRRLSPEVSLERDRIDRGVRVVNHVPEPRVLGLPPDRRRDAQRREVASEQRREERVRRIGSFAGWMDRGKFSNDDTQDTKCFGEIAGYASMR